MKKLILLAIACALLAFWACARPGHVRNEAEFKGKTGVSHRVPWKQGLLAVAKLFF